jgi:hypothetical protein
MPAWLWLGDVPAWRLLDLVAPAAPRTRFTGAGSPALGVRNGVLEVGFPGVPGTGRERAVAVPDLDEVAQRLIRLISVRLIAVVTLERRHRSQFHDEVPPVEQR